MDQSLQVRVEQHSSSFKSANHFSCIEKINNLYSKTICLYCINEDYEKENKGFIKETFWEKGKHNIILSSCFDCLEINTSWFGKKIKSNII